MQTPHAVPLERACRIVGSQKLLATALGVRPPSVSEWMKRAVPLDRCAAIEAATNGEVRCEDLRPDVDWTRDEHGCVTGYHVRVHPAAPAKVA